MNMGIGDIRALLTDNDLDVQAITSGRDATEVTVTLIGTCGQHEQALEALQRTPGVMSARLLDVSRATIEVVWAPE